MPISFREKKETPESNLSIQGQIGIDPEEFSGGVWVVTHEAEDLNLKRHDSVAKLNQLLG